MKMSGKTDEMGKRIEADLRKNMVIRYHEPLLGEERILFEREFPDSEFNAPVIRMVRIGGDKIIGIAAIFLRRKIFKSLSIWVDPAWRSKGIGSIMLERLLQGFHAVFLATSPDNSHAIRLYRKYGFRPISYWKNKRITVIVMLRISLRGK